MQVVDYLGSSMNCGTYPIKEGLDKHGFVFLPGEDPDISTHHLSQRLGSVIDVESILPQSGVPNVQQLKPHPKQYFPETRYSGIYGLGSFPLHTDLAHWATPPRYFLLRCINGTPSVATYLLPVSAIENNVGRLVLRQSLFKPRRPNRYGQSILLGMRAYKNGDFLFRWDNIFLAPMNSSARALSQFMQNLDNCFEHMVSVYLENTGDTLIVDNWHMLHGRSEAFCSKERLIERVYLKEVV